MEVEFRTTVDDYLAFYRYFYFQRKLALRVLWWGLVCFIIGSVVDRDKSLFSWTFMLGVLVSALAGFLLGFAIPYWRSVHRFRKALEVQGNVADPPKKRMVLTAAGFTLQWIGEGMENQPVEHYLGEGIKGVEDTGRFIIVLLYHGFPVVIPKSYFSADNEVGNFIGLLGYRSAAIRASGQESDRAKAGRVAYWGLLGIIPNVGVIAGIVLLVQGIFRYKSWKLIIIGAADILFTFVFWAVFIHWTTTSSLFTIPMKQFSQGQLNTLFKSVEFYKLQHGQYPDSLRQVEDIKGNVWITDPILHKGMKTVDFYYEKTGDRYWLFSVGEDGVPFSADDIFPAMKAADSTKFGLRLR